MSIHTIALTILISAASTVAYAEIYRSTDAEGNVIYSDQPRPGAKTMNLPGLTSYPGTAYSTSSTNNASADQSKNKPVYSEFNISTPANDETIRANSGDISVSLGVSPALKAGHVVVLDVNGQQFKGNSTLFNLKNVDRGTHILKAHIENAAGEKQTDVVSNTFHLKRASVLNNSANNSASP